jgi:hypothetical protein
MLLIKKDIRKMNKTYYLKSWNFVQLNYKYFVHFRVLFIFPFREQNSATTHYIMLFDYLEFCSNFIGYAIFSENLLSSM